MKKSRSWLLNSVDIILPNPDRDRHPGPADPDVSISTKRKDKLYFFPENLKLLSKVLTIIKGLVA
jgi:hypothetical protein